MTEADNIDSNSQPEHLIPHLTAQEIIRDAFPVFASAQSIPVLSTHASYVIPLGKEPRWILPQRAHFALPVLESWQPHKLKSRIKWKLILLGCAGGFLSRFPGVSRVRMQVDSSYWQTWLPGFSNEWESVIYVGSPSHTRKAIVFFVDRDSSVRAVAKLPLRAAAKSAILNEANILRRIELKQVLPQILFADDRHGVAAQTWIQGKSMSRAFGKEHIELLAQLRNIGESTRLSDFREEVACAADIPDFPLDRALLNRTLSVLEDTRELPAFIEHRDFAPWNLRSLPGGGLTLVDWEWTVEKSLPWQDICHFFYIQDYLFRDMGKVWEVLSVNHLLKTYIHRFGIPREVLPGLTLYYLLRTLISDWANQERERVRYTIDQIRTVLEAQE